MRATNLITKIWGVAAVTGLDPDSPEALATHRALLKEKKFLRQLYVDLYQPLLIHATDLNALEGAVLEIGSGGGFLKELLPNVITSDVCPSPGIDQVISADHLPFREGALKAILMLNVLHHMADPEAFFREADRCLIPRGRLVMVEPSNSLWGRLFYKTLHHEPFNEEALDWKLPASGRMSCANVALPWIVFWRDRARFEKQFPRLKIRSISRHTVTSYLVSGGLSFRALAPAFSYPLFRLLDKGLSRLTGWFPIFQTIVVEKQ